MLTLRLSLTCQPRLRPLHLLNPQVIPKFSPIFYTMKGSQSKKQLLESMGSDAHQSQLFKKHKTGMGTH
jgi:hypothetical protein